MIILRLIQSVPTAFEATDNTPLLTSHSVKEEKVNGEKLGVGSDERKFSVCCFSTLLSKVEEEKCLF